MRMMITKGDALVVASLDSHRTRHFWGEIMLRTVRFGYPILKKKKYNDLDFDLLWAEDEFFAYQNIDCTAQDCEYSLHVYVTDNLTLSTLKEKEHLIMGDKSLG